MTRRIGREQKKRKRIAEEQEEAELPQRVCTEWKVHSLQGNTQSSCRNMFTERNFSREAFPKETFSIETLPEQTLPRETLSRMPFAGGQFAAPMAVPSKQLCNKQNGQHYTELTRPIIVRFLLRINAPGVIETNCNLRNRLSRAMA